jgi:hypothetical protein
LALSGPINAEAHALKIAVEVASAWHKNGASGQAEVPMGVVATIAAAGLVVDDPARLAEEMTSASPTDFVNLARQVWAVVVTRRPDVTLWAYPLLRWLFADLDEPARQRIKRSALAALNAGQLELTATDRRFDCDLFGPLLGALRSRTATKVNAQMYTPGDIACALTAVALDDLNSRSATTPSARAGSSAWPPSSSAAAVSTRPTCCGSARTSTNSPSLPWR